MKKTILLFLAFLLISCSTKEIIGNYKYSTKTNRVNCGEFDALIFKYKQYHFDGEKSFSKLIKAQKLDFETKKDTIFAYGKLDVKKEKNKTYIITKEIYINGYDNFTDTDSVIRNYEQLKNGKVKFSCIKYYRKGVVKTYPNN